MRISLFRFAATDAPTELAKIKNAPNKIKGALWQAHGKDPEVDDKLNSFVKIYIDFINKHVPRDVDEAFAGLCVIFLNKVGLAMLVEHGAKINSILDMSNFFNRFMDMKPWMERFYKAKPYMSRAGESADLPKYNTFQEVIRAVANTEEWIKENIKDEALWKKQVLDKREIAHENTIYLHGPQDKLPPRGHGTGIRADDLVNGRLERSEWQVVIPKSKEASCYWGAETEWCTAHPDDKLNYFEHYAPDGDLIIFINNRTGNRYQFHFESEQFMNSKDEAMPQSILRDQLFEFAKSFQEQIPSYKADPQDSLKSHHELRSSLNNVISTKNELGYFESVDGAPAYMDGGKLEWYSGGEITRTVQKRYTGISVKFHNQRLVKFYARTKDGFEKWVKLDGDLEQNEPDGSPSYVSSESIYFQKGGTEFRQNGFASLFSDSMPSYYFSKGKPVDHYVVLEQMFNNDEEAMLQEGIKQFNELYAIEAAKAEEALKQAETDWEKWNPIWRASIQKAASFTLFKSKSISLFKAGK